jgi:hypothetical protein
MSIGGATGRHSTGRRSLVFLAHFSLSLFFLSFGWDLGLGLESRLVAMCGSGREEESTRPVPVCHLTAARARRWPVACWLLAEAAGHSNLDDYFSKKTKKKSGDCTSDDVSGNQLRPCRPKSSVLFWFHSEGGFVFDVEMLSTGLLINHLLLAQSCADFSCPVC